MFSVSMSARQRTVKMIGRAAASRSEAYLVGARYQIQGYLAHKKTPQVQEYLAHKKPLPT